jgi:hypothetical protein
MVWWEVAKEQAGGWRERAATAAEQSSSEWQQLAYVSGAGHTEAEGRNSWQEEPAAPGSHGSTRIAPAATFIPGTHDAAASVAADVQCCN